LTSIDKVRVPLRRVHGLTTRQLWRLQDLRDGGGLGFTTELFFLSLRQLLSVSSSQESNKVFYTGTFRNIVSRWRESRESLGTQNLLLNIVCDIVIQGRGVFRISHTRSISRPCSLKRLATCCVRTRAQIRILMTLCGRLRLSSQKIAWTWVSDARHLRLFPNSRGTAGSRGTSTILQIPYARLMSAYVLFPSVHLRCSA